MAGSPQPRLHRAPPGERLWEVWVDKNFERDEYVIGKIKEIEDRQILRDKPGRVILSAVDELGAYMKVLAMIKEQTK